MTMAPFDRGQRQTDALSVLRALHTQLHAAAPAAELPHEARRGEPGSPHPRLQAALSVLARGYGAERVVLIVHRPEQKLARIEAAFGLSDDERRAGRYAPGEGLVGCVLERAQALSFDGEALAGRGASSAAAWPRPEALGRCVCVPVLTRAHGVVGALGWEREPARQSWLHDDIEVLTVAAALLSDAVVGLRTASTVRAVRDRDRERDGQRGFGAGAPLGAALSGGDALVARAVKTREVLALLRQVARTSLPVWVSGESGAGKTLIARTLAGMGTRAAAPLLELRCDALSASEQAEGPEAWFSRAKTGTLLLDQVGELSPALQAELLHALQRQETGGLFASDARVISTSSVELQACVAAGRFRQDLFYRLQAFPIAMPSLRERKADLSSLVEVLVSKHVGARKRPALEVSAETLACLSAHDWPGNVRELDNVLARAVLVTRGKVIEPDALPKELRADAALSGTQLGTLDEQLARFERRVLLEALREVGGSKAAAARALHVTPRVLAYRLQRLGIDARR